MFRETVASTPDEAAVAFFAKNAERVRSVADMLLDDGSKEVFLELVKFRQTRDKRDFPSRWDWRSSYFIQETKPVPGEVFIDCGAYTGDTLDIFLKRCPAYKHIVAFEPDPQNYHHLTKKYGTCPTRP